MKDNCFLVTRRVIQLLGVSFTKEYLKETILSHPDYPSILCVADTLEKYQMKAMAVQVEDKNEIVNLPTPPVLQISRKGNKVFCVVHSVSKDTVEFYNEYDKLETLSCANFVELWTGILLLVEKTEDAKEPNIKARVYKQKLTLLLSVLFLFFVGVSVAYGLDDILTLFATDVSIYAIIKFCGIIVGGLLLWFDIDQYNPTLQSLCVGGKKINCNSVLNSKYAKLFKGNISLSLLSFSYFFATFLLFLFTGFKEISLGLLSFLSLCAFPVILLSAYSQAFVIKQWCKFCIGVQLLLVAEIIVVILGKYYNKSIDLSIIALLGALFIFPILLWLWLKPLLLKSKEQVFYKRNLAKIKYNPDTFWSLLEKSRQIEPVSKNLGVFLENENAQYTVIKVCNPYCGPCAQAHPILDSLYKEGKINLQIIFTSSLSKDDFRTPPAKHLLALYHQYDKDKAQTLEALDAWYKAKVKDYSIFSKQFTIDKGALDSQNKSIEKMYEWCKATKIQHTPTIFINGYELPEEYSVQDLKEIF